ncbi:MAG: FAD-dependent oxidoreductase [Acidimicrobiaceae bacterium]|nr:FAD-dependent oxidoreductase [Acidimicrobiaceae bacterium]MCY4176192.1 FAD-dependent oxidoreductase [Acidimicrobiaceae bacterium]MCY4294396.1 FAD-dependent oxidoreductase [Acidimicrobiaceae bacterium]
MSPASANAGPGKPRVAVIGGGLAGLSAAIEAADRGAAVTLFERRPRLGGATWSFERNGIWFDNGQHVYMRCCTAYRAFLQRIGADSDVRLQKRLDVVVLSPGGRRAAIKRTIGPAPLHLAPALLAYRHLSLRQRLAAARAGLALRRLDPDDRDLDRMTFGEWLEARGQDAAAVEGFWNLIVLPTVNVNAAEVSLKLAARVFVTGMLTEAGAADIGWSRTPLTALHADAGRRALQAAGGEIRSRLSVTAVKPGAQGLEVHLSKSPGTPRSSEPPTAGGSTDDSGSTGDDGTSGADRSDAQAAAADAVVVAVPHDAAAGLLPPGTLAAQERLSELGSSPIVNVHLVYDRPVTDLDFFATVGSDAQFVFDRTEAAGLDDGRQCLAVSLSAAESYIGRTSADLVSHFSAEITRLLPAAADAEVTDSMVTRERSATFMGRPGTDPLRAPCESRLPGVYVAGAWTDTGWPATMEGAVRSGTAAGRLAVEFASVAAGRSRGG